MGLELVELVMAIEDAFGLTIPDDEASRLETVGQVTDYVVACLRDRAGPPAGPCPSARTFYRLRRELTTRLGVPRPAVRPGRPIGELIPAGFGRWRWPAVARAVGLRPDGFHLLRPLSGRFPPPGVTVSELIRTRSGTPYLPGGGPVVDAEAVAATIRRLRAEHAGVPVPDVRPDSHFVRDLDMG